MTEMAKPNQDSILYSDSKTLIIGMGNQATVTEFVLMEMSLSAMQQHRTVIKHSSIDDTYPTYIPGLYEPPMIDFSVVCKGQPTVIANFDPAEMQFEKEVFSKLTINEMFDMINKKLKGK